MAPTSALSLVKLDLRTELCKNEWPDGLRVALLKVPAALKLVTQTRIHRPLHPHSLTVMPQDTGMGATRTGCKALPRRP